MPMVQNIRQVSAQNEMPLGFHCYGGVNPRGVGTLWGGANLEHCLLMHCASSYPLAQRPAEVREGHTERVRYFCAGIGLNAEA